MENTESEVKRTDINYISSSLQAPQKVKVMPTKPKMVMSAVQLQVMKNAVTMGMNREQIAKLLGISDSTLKRLYKRDSSVKEILDRGKDMVDQFVVGKLLEHIQDNNVAATLFYLKTRLGWRETNRTELEISKIDKEAVIADLNKEIFG